MRNIVMYSCWILLSLGCTSIKKSNNNQGIIGEVRWLEGNMMPAVGDTILRERLRGIPIEREVYIFNALKRDHVVKGNNSLFKQVKGQLVSRLRTDKKGRFKANLSPGKYSIFTLEKGGYFANIYDGNNFINPVTVQPSTFTEIVILVNYKAYY